MVIHRPKTLQEAIKLRHDIPASVYLAGGTEILRLNSSVPAQTELIDINGLCMSGIKLDGDYVVIGGLAVLQDLATSDLVPGFLAKSATFCSSFEKRNAATVAGNIALKRQDSYLIPALVAAEAELVVEGKDGERQMPISEYLEMSGCKGIIKEVRVRRDRKGWAKKIAHTSSSHATMIAASSEGLYALEVSASGLVYGKTPDLYKDMVFNDDLSGSAEYKRYLASVIFSQEV